MQLQKTTVNKGGYFKLETAKTGRLVQNWFFSFEKNKINFQRVILSKSNKNKPIFEFCMPKFKTEKRVCRQLKTSFWFRKTGKKRAAVPTLKNKRQFTANPAR